MLSAQISQLTLFLCYWGVLWNFCIDEETEAVGPIQSFVPPGGEVAILKAQA